MKQAESTPTLFDRLRIVLVETSRPGNIGSVARAMKTMGFSELVLVNPRFDGALMHEESVAFASGAVDILERTRVVGSMEEALDGIHFAAAVSARLREFSPPVMAPRELAQQLAAGEARAALIFGNERFGLPNEIVERCNVLVNIPANPEYSSLNLAQAAQVLVYECRMAALDGQRAASDVGFQGDAASVAQIDGMYAHLEEALVQLGFLDANNPRKLMPRLKRMFSRAALETEEVNILRGIARQIIVKCGRKE
ncbi:RNA methyltransferase [Massilia sp. SM-13]|uniref:RNA methyltransferase n=1 Tax=Pseudoduganella rhizocola TaxID=3382643 RepID=UPI0038B456E7